MQYDRRSGILFDSFAMDLPRRARPRERGTCGRAEIRKSAGCVSGEIRCREAAGTGMAIAEAWMRGNGVLRGPSAFMGRVQLVRASEDARTVRASSDGCAVQKGRQGLCPRAPSRKLSFLHLPHRALRDSSVFMRWVQLVRASADARTLRASFDGCAVQEDG